MHPKVLGAEAWRAAAAIRGHQVLDRWILAGGTGLALQLGHRKSEDLDFFSSEDFDSDSLLGRLSEVGTVAVQDRGSSTLHVLFDRVRLTFLKLGRPLLFRGIAYRGLTLADVRDIAVMKVVAIGGKGSRGDFIDLCCCINAIGDLDYILSLVEKRYRPLDYNRYHLLKSLAYFEDAEQEPVPEMLRDISWETVRTAILEEVRRLSP